MDKNERIELKRAELMRSFERLPADKLKVSEDLIGQAAFMSVELEDLAEIISKEGMTEIYTNGANQSGRKVSSNAKMYSTLIGKYNSIIAQLMKHVPAPEKKSKEKTADEIAAEREAAERQERYERNQQRQRARDEAFDEALRKGKVKHAVGSEMRDVYRAFCEEWDRQHSAEYEVM